MQVELTLIAVFRSRRVLVLLKTVVGDVENHIADSIQQRRLNYEQ